MVKNTSECIREMQKDLNDQRAAYAAVNKQLKKTQDAADEAIHKLQDDYTEVIAVLAIVLSKYCHDGYAVIHRADLLREIEHIKQGVELIDVGENMGGDYILRSAGDGE